MSELPPRILVAEDDEDIASALRRGLEREGFSAVTAADAETALAIGRDPSLAAAVVDVMLGAGDGREVVRTLRQGGVTMPIVMLSALSGVEDRAEGLESGADDYVAKPFDMADLIARIRVQARRRLAQPAPALSLGGLTYDPARRVATGAGREVPLTEREGLLLGLFIAHAGEVLSRGRIFDQIWAGGGGTAENVVDVYVGYLRRKLAPLASFGIDLRTVRGRGFILMEDRHG